MASALKDPTRSARFAALFRGTARELLDDLARLPDAKTELIERDRALITNARGGKHLISAFRAHRFLEYIPYETLAQTEGGRRYMDILRLVDPAVPASLSPSSLPPSQAILEASQRLGLDLDRGLISVATDILRDLQGGPPPTNISQLLDHVRQSVQTRSERGEINADELEAKAQSALAALAQKNPELVSSLTSLSEAHGASSGAQGAQHGSSSEVGSAV